MPQAAPPPLAAARQATTKRGTPQASWFAFTTQPRPSQAGPRPGNQTLEL
jgi:hypothetical protein